MCKVLIADDSDVMRAAVRKTLEEERNINIVGEASTFAETTRMICDFRPDVVLLDLHMPEKDKLTPDMVKTQLGTVCTVAISFANDSDSKALAESYGAATLLDKMTLYTEMLPAIRQCHPHLALPRKPRNQASHAA